MSNNKNVGAGRQSHTASDGTYLERRYIYLDPGLWESLHYISRESGLTASQYLAKVIASTGKPKGNNNNVVFQ